MHDHDILMLHVTFFRLSSAQNQDAQEPVVPDNVEPIPGPFAPPIIFHKIHGSVGNSKNDHEVPVPDVEIANSDPVIYVPPPAEEKSQPQNPEFTDSESSASPETDTFLKEKIPQTPSSFETKPDGTEIPYKFLVPPSEGTPGSDSDTEPKALSEEELISARGRYEDSEESSPALGLDQREDDQPQVEDREDEGKSSEESPSSSDKSTESSTTGESINKSEDSIPSFSEWTQLQLSQRKESIINNIKNKTSLQEGKNFASPDCGAKVINSNPEAQNPSGVISSSHDEYMLNR